MSAKNARIIPLLVLLLSVQLLEPPLLLAVEEHGAGHAPATLGEFLLAISSFWINFLIYAALLYFILRKPFKDVWQQRREAYARNITESRSRLAQSKQRLMEAQIKLSTVHGDRERLREEIQKEAHDECQQVIAQAKERSKGLIKAAHELAKAERVTAERQVQAEIAEQALALARNELRKEITPETDQAYRQSVLQSVKQLLQ